MSNTGLRDNYYALMAAICSNRSVDSALKSIFRGPGNGDNGTFTGRPQAEINQDAVTMAGMKQSMTFRQVGDHFGISAGAVYVRIKRLEQRMEGEE